MDMEIPGAWYVLDGRTPRNARSVEEWAEFMNDPARKRVAFTKVDDVEISTTFLGIDHRGTLRGGAPLLFETMIFGGEHDQFCARYETYGEAEKGHRKAVAMVNGVETRWAHPDEKTGKSE